MIKKICVFIGIPFLIILIFLFICIVIILQENQNDIQANFQFSNEVEECREVVNKYSTKYLHEYLDIDKNSYAEIDNFNNLFLSQIQVHYDNEVNIGKDSMYISNYSTHYNNCAICNKHECKNKENSIDYGIKRMCLIFKNNDVKKMDNKNLNDIKYSFEQYFNNREDNKNLFKISSITSSKYASDILNYYDMYILSQQDSSSDEIVGKGRNSMIKYALSQVGTGGSASWKYNGVSSGHWCTYFAIMCAGKAQLKEATSLLHPYVPTVVHNFSTKGLYKSKSSGYKAKAGDFVIRYGNSHIGIVISRKGNAIETVEGNTGGIGSGATFWNSSKVNHYYNVTYGIDGYCTY